MVIVNGIRKNISQQRCIRCISDSTCPGITFDTKGVCNFCYLHDKWVKIYPNDERGQEKLIPIIEKIKRDGKGKKFDCAVGISGGKNEAVACFFSSGLDVLFIDNFSVSKNS